MSAETVQTIMRRIGDDPAFRERFGNERDEALAEYAQGLTENERDSLTALDGELIEGIAGLGTRRGGWRQALVPSSFKEAGALLLTAVLALTFVGMLFVTIATLGSDPRGVAIGNTTQQVDEYGRAKELLNVVVPLFGAAVTFWLGVAIESRQADENQQAKEREMVAREGAEKQEREMRSTAIPALHAAKARYRSARVSASGEGPAGMPSEGATADVERIIDDALRKLGG